MSKEKWIISYIEIGIALLGITLVFYPPAKEDEYRNYKFFAIFIMAIISPILTHLYFKYLSSKSVVKKFKNSDIVNGKIQYFKSRNDLDLNEYLGIAEKEIIFVSLTNEIISKDINLQKLIRYCIMDRYISVKFLVLNPDSHVVGKICSFFGLNEGDFKKTINEALTILCELKKDLTNNKDLMQIETYDYYLKNSLIIIDHDVKGKHKFTSIKIEQYIMGSDSGSRPSYIVFLNNNESYYTKCFEDYFELGKTKHYC